MFQANRKFAGIFSLLIAFALVVIPTSSAVADSVQQTYSVGAGNDPFAIAVTPDGSKIIVGNITSNSVKIYNNQMVLQATLTSGLDNPQTIVVNSAGTKAYVADFLANNFVTIDLSTNQLLGNAVAVSAGAFSIALSADEHTAFIPGYNGNSISVVNLLNNTLSSTISLPAGCNPQDVAVASGVLAVACYVSNKVLFYDAVTLQALSPNSLSFVSVHSLITSPDGLSIYAGSSSSIKEIDPATLSFTSFALSVFSDKKSLQVTPDGATLYAADSNSSTLKKIDLVTGTITQTLSSIPGSPTRPAITANGASLYIANFTSDSVSQIAITPAQPFVSPAVSPSSQTVTATVGTPITATLSLTNAGLFGTVSYSVAPALPQGLTLNSSTGVITGTPTITQAAANYTVTATGTFSGTATSVVSISVASELARTGSNPTLGMFFLFSFLLLSAGFFLVWKSRDA